MITYKFDVLVKEIPTVPELKVGTAVIPVTHETLPGGYEVRVWRKLDDGTDVSTRKKYLSHFESFTVEGEDMGEVIRLIGETCDSVRSRARRHC